MKSTMRRFVDWLAFDVCGGTLSWSWDRDTQQDYVLHLLVNIPTTNPSRSYDDRFNFCLRIYRLVIFWIPTLRRETENAGELIRG